MFEWGEGVDEAFFQKREAQITYIGKDTWIGHGSIIFPNLKEGRRAIVAGGSVVTKDVPPYAIVAGVPAKVIKMRYTSEEVECLEKTQ